MPLDYISPHIPVVIREGIIWAGQLSVHRGAEQPFFVGSLYGGPAAEGRAVRVA